MAELAGGGVHDPVERALRRAVREVVRRVVAGEGDDRAAVLGLPRELGDELPARPGVDDHVPVEGLDGRVEDPGVDATRRGTGRGPGAGRGRRRGRDQASGSAGSIRSPGSRTTGAPRGGGRRRCGRAGRRAAQARPHRPAASRTGRGPSRRREALGDPVRDADERSGAGDQRRGPRGSWSDDIFHAPPRCHPSGDDGRRHERYRLRSRPVDVARAVRWGFATPGPLRDKLTALAFGGGKVVTSGLLANYEIEGEPVEQPGDISILLDSDERPVAMIEDVRSIVIRLADMTDEDAIDEGEGYADAAAFRVSHEDHWNGFIDEVREGSATRRSRSPTTRRSSWSGSGSPPSSGPMGRRSSRASAPRTRPIGRPSTPSSPSTTPTSSRGAASSSTRDVARR